jgi:hypothetical protein
MVFLNLPKIICSNNSFVVFPTVDRCVLPDIAFAGGIRLGDTIED